MDPTTAALLGGMIGGAFGALGAIGAQLVAGFLTGKRERENRKHDQQAAIEERRYERQVALDERFFPIRIEKFALFLAQMRSLFERIERARSDDSKEQLYDVDFRELYQAQAEVVLISPDSGEGLAETVLALMTLHVQSLTYVYATPENKEDAADELRRIDSWFQNSWVKLEDRMRIELGLKPTAAASDSPEVGAAAGS